jgi:MFS family permease
LNPEDSGRKEAPGAAPRSFAALRHPGYRAYFLLSALSMMADNVEHVISYWIMYQKFHSPALGGFAVLSHWLPFLFFSLWSGALADRYDPRRIIQIGMLMFMAVSVAWGVLFITDTLEMWHAAVLLVLHGVAGVLWTPASQLLLHDIVGREHLQSAVRLNATSRNLGLLLGPAVGGVLMLAAGPEAGLLFNALLYLPFLWWLWKAPYGPRFKPERPRRVVKGWEDIASAMREISGNRAIVSMTLLAAFSSLFVAGGYHAQMPEFAHDLGHGEADLSYSVLLAADAAGALTAGFVLESRSLLRSRPRTAFILAMLWCCAIGGFALVASYPLALGLLFLTGFLELSYSSMAQTIVQLNAPEHIRGKVIGLFNMAIGMRAFSGVTIGVAGALIGIHWSLALSAMCLLAVIMGLLAFMMRSRPAGA